MVAISLFYPFLLPGFFSTQRSFCRFLGFLCQHTLLVVCLFFTGSFEAAYTQDHTCYSRRFEFNPGIYKDIAEFRKNQPSIQGIIPGAGRGESDSFMTFETVTYIDESGKKVKVKARDVWGYSENGNVYVSYKERFHRVFIIGSIMHFTVNLYRSREPSPAGKEGEMFAYIERAGTVPTPYFIDYMSGAVKMFTPSEMGVFLSEYDDMLYVEFAAIANNKKKRERLYEFMKRYNEAHPIYFPLYN